MNLSSSCRAEATSSCTRFGIMKPVFVWKAICSEWNKTFISFLLQLSTLDSNFNCQTKLTFKIRNWNTVYPSLLGNVPLVIVASGGVSRRRPRFANRHFFKLWADSFHEARTLNKICFPNFCDLRWVRSLWRDCRINWNAMFSWLLEGKNFQDGGVMRLGRTATLYYRMLSSIAKFKSHFLFLFSFWWASEANWNNLKLGIEVIRNFREVNIFSRGLHW